MNKTCVLIVGMHHSGTSLLSGTINKLGFTIGKTPTTVTTFHNQNGYFENKNLMKFADKVLNHFGFSWKLPPKPGILNFQIVKKKFLKELIGLVSNEFNNKSKILIKDPRWASLLPLIHECMKRLNYKLYILDTYRHEYDSIRSLKDSNKTSEELNSKIRHIIHLSIVNFIESTPSVIHLGTVQYQAMLKHPTIVIKNLCKSLRIKYPGNDWCNKYVNKKFCHYNTGECVYNEQFDYIHVINHYQVHERIKCIREHFKILKKQNNKKILFVVAIPRDNGGKESFKYYQLEDQLKTKNIKTKVLFYHNNGGTLRQLWNVYKYFLTKQKVTGSLIGIFEDDIYPNYTNFANETNLHFIGTINEKHSDPETIEKFKKNFGLHTRTNCPIYKQLKKYLEITNNKNGNQMNLVLCSCFF
jgi:hypothetical protein